MVSYAFLLGLIIGGNMKLRTLKDIWMNQYGLQRIHKETLREEAVKDIQALDFEEDGSFQVKDYIMWKFNLKEEDLV